MMHRDGVEMDQRPAADVAADVQARPGETAVNTPGKLPNTGHMTSSHVLTSPPAPYLFICIHFRAGIFSD